MCPLKMLTKKDTLSSSYTVIILSALYLLWRLWQQRKKKKICILEGHSDRQ